MFAGPVPAAVPEFPGDLKRDLGLARARGHRDQDAVVAHKNSLDDAMDGDFLVVAWDSTALLEKRRQQLLCGLVVFDSLTNPQP